MNAKNTVIKECNVSVDGADFIIQEPKHFSPSWFSHKFKGPGLRYEIGISIHDDTIVHANGPFKCGDFPDVKIFQNELKQKLLRNEKVIADNGYKDNKCLRASHLNNAHHKRFHGRARGRHEVVNGKMKRFSILKSKFRHNLDLHSIFFYSILKLTQLTLDFEEQLFSCWDRMILISNDHFIKACVGLWCLRGINASHTISVQIHMNLLLK